MSKLDTAYTQPPKEFLSAVSDRESARAPKREREVGEGIVTEKEREREKESGRVGWVIWVGWREWRLGMNKVKE